MLKPNGLGKRVLAYFDFWFWGKVALARHQFWKACRKGEPPVFGRSVNPTLTRGGKFSPNSITSLRGFSDLATTLIGDICTKCTYVYYVFSTNQNAQLDNLHFDWRAGDLENLG